MDKLLIVLTAGMDQPKLARTALMFAAISASMGVKTTLYAVQDAIDVLVEGVAEKETPKPNGASIKQRLEEAIRHGVVLDVCETACAAKKIKQENLVEGAKIAGAATLIDLALDSDSVLCF
ncbi:MAG: DsrE family protein [Candidatus Hydrothermarchaeales archaeon]